MDVTKEVQDLLKFVRDLDRETESNQMKFENIRSEATSSSDSLPDVDEDIIDLEGVDLSDSENWLCQTDNSNSHITDTYSWLRQDIDQIKDSDYLSQRFLFQQAIGKMDNKMKNHIDSRTFTRPKKKMSRPSLESFVDKRLLNYSFNDLPGHHSSFESMYSRHNDTYPFLSDIGRFKLEEEPAQIFNSINTKPKFQLGRYSLVELDDTNKMPAPNPYDLSKNLQSIIDEQAQDLQCNKSKKSDIVFDPMLKHKLTSFITDKENCAVKKMPNVFEKRFQNPFENIMETSGDSFQNMSPPSLVNSFASINMNSLTEADFITAMNQPQDLYLSFTSVTSNDEDRTLCEEPDDTSFANNVREMNETFIKDLEEQNDTFTKDEAELNDEKFDLNTTVTVSDIPCQYSSGSDETFVRNTEYIPQPINENSGPECITNNTPCFDTFKKNKSAKFTVLNDISSELNKVEPEPEKNVFVDMNKTFDRSFTKKIAVNPDHLKTFTKNVDTSLKKCFESQDEINTTFNKVLDTNYIKKVDIPIIDIYNRPQNFNTTKIITQEDNLNTTFNKNTDVNYINKNIDVKYTTDDLKTINKDMNETFCKPVELNNTYMKVPSETVSSIEQVNTIMEFKHPNDVFNETKTISSGSTESLDDRTSSTSESSMSSAKMLNVEEINQLARMQEQSLHQIMSTPKPNSNLSRQIWSSSEALSPITKTNSDDCIHDTTRVIKSAHSSPGRRPTNEILAKAINPPKMFSKIRQPELRKPEMRPMKVECRPTMIVKPMEVKSMPETSTMPAMSQQQTSTQNEPVPGLRPPSGGASALPRRIPTAAAPAGSGIPRPVSRIPAPRSSLKPPGSHISRPSSAKSNWMDGCY